MAWGIWLGLALAIAVAIVAPRPAALVAILAVVADVRQQGDLARALDGRGDLVLMPAAGARDAARPDLAPVGHVLAEARDVLVVDLLDLVAAVAARLAAAGAGTALLVTPASRPAALLRHLFGDLFESTSCALIAAECARPRRGAVIVGGRR